MRLRPPPRKSWKRLWLDTETFSDIPIKRGHHAYFDSPNAQITIAAWALNDDPVTVEDLTTVLDDGTVEVRMPSLALQEHIFDADEIIFHNSQFDRTGIRKLWGIDIDVRRIFDTLVCAMAHSLPGSLGKLCGIMQVPIDEAKDEEGSKLIRLFCMPQPKKFKLRRATKATHPVEWARFLSYAGSDITAMRSLYHKLPRWNFDNYRPHAEFDLWVLDQKSNDRGFAVDLDMAQKAMATVEREQHRLATETRQLTDNEVAKATKRDDLLVHIFVEYGIYLPDLKKDTLERRLNDDEIPDALKQLLRVRLASTTTSTAKFAALQRSVSSDNVLRGTTVFCGALRTGRWSGRLFQPHNMMRPDMTPEAIIAAIEALKADALDLVAANVMRELSNILRGLIIARPGMKIVASDLEQIESRGSAWLAGEEWKLEAIGLYDSGEGFDNYVMAVAEAMGFTPEFVMEDKKRGGFWRQVGKVMELAQGYEGGVGAWLAFAMVYRLDLDALAEDAHPRLPKAARDQAEIMWDWRNKKDITTFGLNRKVFVVIETFKSLWRAAHPAFADKDTGIWVSMDRAAKEAIRYPGHEIECRKIAFQKKGAWLRMILPSGRVLCYPAPKIRHVGGKEQLSYLGVNQYTRKWSRIATYGGKLFENATQAVARDVMAFNMPEIEDAGFHILLTVHDEVVTEAEKNSQGRFTSQELSAILAKNPPWLRGCPLAAGGFEDERYRKD